MSDRSFFSFVFMPMLIVVTAVFFSGCKSSGVSNAPAIVNDTITDLSNRKLIKEKQLYTSTTDVIVLDTVYLAGDTLHLITPKIWGCNAENFKLLWHGLFTKSLPPQTTLKLLQQAEPACRERNFFHLTFSLSSIHFRQVSDTLDFSRPQRVRQPMLLRVAGWKEAIKFEN